MTFSEPEIAICGNGVVEEGEECDCGWEEDCLETCCWPQRTKYSVSQIPCTLRRPAALCSPSQGPCCNRDCSYNIGDKCRDDNGCRGDSYCDGRGVQCPPSIMKPNKTVCNEEFVCFQGVRYFRFATWKTHDILIIWLWVTFYDVIIISLSLVIFKTVKLRPGKLRNINIHNLSGMYGLHMSGIRTGVMSV